MRIAVAGIGYVGLSLAVLLSQNNEVTAVEINPEKVEELNHWPPFGAAIILGYTVKDVIS